MYGVCMCGGVSPEKRSCSHFRHKGEGKGAEEKPQSKHVDGENMFIAE